jgi:hypothetical protein
MPEESAVDEGEQDGPDAAEEGVGGLIGDGAVRPVGMVVVARD